MQSSFFNSDLCPQVGDDSRLFCRVNSSLCLRRDSGHCGHSTDWRAACCNVAARQLVVKKWKPVEAAGELVHTSWWLCKPRSVCTLPPLLHNLHNFAHFTQFCTFCTFYTILHIFTFFAHFAMAVQTSVRLLCSSPAAPQFQSLIVFQTPSNCQSPLDHLPIIVKPLWNHLPRCTEHTLFDFVSHSTK